MGTKLQMIGGGKMGQALLSGLIEAGWAQPSQLTVVEVAATQREHLARQFPAVSVSDRPEAGVDTVLAVKPFSVVDVCRGLDSPRRVVSIAAGVTLDAIESVLGSEVPVIRVMPNTPALVGAGAAGLAGGRAATEDDLAWAQGILSAVGYAVVLPESSLDAVTGLSGSGPAYVFLLAEALTDAGVAVGLSREVASNLAVNTIYGAGKMMVETGLDPVQLRANVTTPGGTTAAGLAELERGGIRATVAQAVLAATGRSAELGQS